jgi:hypothetical protein
MEDRTLPSASPMNPLPVVSVASPPAVPSASAVTSFMFAMMEQRAQLIAVIEQDLSNALYTVGQVIAQEVSAFEQQVDRIFDINPSPQTPQSSTPMPQSDSGMGRGNSSGSGSGSGATPTAHSAPNQTQNNSTTQTGSGSSSGSGSGSGSSATMTNGDTTTQGGIKAQPMTSGSGTFGSGGSGTGSVGTGTGSGYANVSGQVWLDNNGDGYENPGEQGYKGITVDLMDPTTAPWTVVMSTTTNSSGYYSFNNIPVGPDPEAFAITVVLSSTSYVDVYATLRAPNVSQIDGRGDSAVFYLKDGGWREIKAGVVSMDVTASNVDTASGDDPSGPLGNNLVTLRDAVETGDNGGGIGHGTSIEPVRFINPLNGDPLSGTINLGAALPDITKSYDIVGPGASTLAVSGNNSYGIFSVDGSVTSTISGLTIEYGDAAYGGGVYNSGTLTLANDNVVNNDPVNGGGIFNTKGKLNVISDDVNNNTATGLGGGLYNGGGGVVTISASEFYNNRASIGGGISNAGAAQGGAGATLDIKNDTTIDYNIATKWGGGINNTSGKVTMTGGSIYENSSGAGGGIYTVGGNVSLTYVYLYANFAKTGDGGGIFDNGGVLLKGGTVQGNTAKSGQGGGIYLVSGALTLAAGGTGNVLIGGGNTAKTGGGLYLASGKTNFSGCDVGGNTATSKAAGVAYTTKATLNPPPPIPAADLTDNDDPGGQPVKV